MNKIVLVGGGGHARSCIDVIEMENKFSIAGIVDKDSHCKNFIYPFIGTDEDLPIIRKNYKFSLISLGQIKTPKIRKNLYKKLKDLEFQLPTIFSPNSYVSKYAKVSEGTIAMHGVVININASIGSNCILNNKCLIEHDAEVGNHCHISTGAVINGRAKVGKGSFIGSGSVINQDVRIGKNCVIGSGVVIKSNIDDGEIVKE